MKSLRNFAKIGDTDEVSIQALNETLVEMRRRLDVSYVYITSSVQFGCARRDAYSASPAYPFPLRTYAGHHSQTLPELSCICS